MIEKEISKILSKYLNSFVDKTHWKENNEYDILMDVFGITPSLKRENRQYRGRELWMCWQLIVSKVAELSCWDEYKPAQRIWQDEPIDLIIWNDAIDTKYRVWSWDSWTLKKFKKYWAMIREDMWYRPVMLMVRDDNLPAAMTALRKWTWEVYIWDDSFDYLLDKTWFDLKSYLISMKWELSL